MIDKDHRFEDAVLPHLDAAYNLARWLTGNDHDAHDVVQDACLRAYRSIGQLRGASDAPGCWPSCETPASVGCGPSARPKLSVRWTIPNSQAPRLTRTPVRVPRPWPLRISDRKVLNDAIAAMPAPFREVVILRELEELSYYDIANVIGAPIGTVMSRLSRGRRLLAQSFKVVLAHAGSGGRR